MKLLYTHLLLYILAANLSFLFLRVSSCSSGSVAAGNQNISQLYKSQKEYLHPSYTIFHRSNTVSELYFKINSKELLYSKQMGKEDFTARLTLHYRLISSYESRDIIDSATVQLNDLYSSSPKDITGKVDVNATFTNNYLLQVDLTDLNRNSTSQRFISISKTDNYSRQNYLVLSVPEKIPLFRDYAGKNERFLIRCKTPPEKLYARYYHRDFPLPAPPFSISNMTPFEYAADSLFSLHPDEMDTAGFVFSKPGFYHIQADTTSKEGLTLFRFDNDFPGVKKPEQLLQPLRYICTRQEYDAMLSYKNVKTAVDSFWVYAGGNYDRARELIKKYYNRVEDANNYFSSYIEGWKTDRGLIYIVYGPPNIVYRSSDAENWVYGEENNFNSLTLTFLKVINPFTDNDYRLERSPLFKNSWFNAVEMWRQGRVYAEK